MSFSLMPALTLRSWFCPLSCAPLMLHEFLDQELKWHTVYISQQNHAGPEGLGMSSSLHGYS